MCEYCEKQIEIAKSPSLSLTIEKEKLIIEAIDCWGNSPIVEEIINFCPMCGRKLSNEKQE